MKPIQNSRSHRSDRKQSIEIIYYTPAGFFLATESDLKPIALTALHYTNRGEPFKELAKVYYQYQDPHPVNSDLDIELDDAADLRSFCEAQNLHLTIGSELLNNRRFKLAMADVSIASIPADSIIPPKPVADTQSVTDSDLVPVPVSG